MGFMARQKCFFYYQCVYFIDLIHLQSILAAIFILQYVPRSCRRWSLSNFKDLQLWSYFNQLQHHFFVIIIATSDFEAMCFYLHNFNHFWYETNNFNLWKRQVRKNFDFWLYNLIQIRMLMVLVLKLFKRMLDLNCKNF